MFTNCKAFIDSVMGRSLDKPAVEIGRGIVECYRTQIYDSADNHMWNTVILTAEYIVIAMDE